MHLDDVLIIGFIILGIYKIFELLIKRKERLMFIEKIFTHCEEKKISGSFHLPDISFGKQNSNLWPLRVSLLLIGIGIGCILAIFIEYNMYMVEIAVSDRFEGFTFFSCIAIFGGTGLLIAHLIESKKDKPD
jgi:hypothetical protein